MAFTTQLLQAALNHLIGAEPWARQQLVPYAGKLISAHVGPFPDAWFVVQADGTLAVVVPGEARADLRINLPASHALRAFGDRARLEQAMQFDGDPALEQAMRALVRSLRWDVEEDLAKVVGDVAAHRIAGGSKRAREWYHDGLARAGQNVGEYLSEERRLVVSRLQFENFAEDIGDCDRRVQALERRVTALEQALRKPM